MSTFGGNDLSDAREIGKKWCRDNGVSYGPSYNGSIVGLKYGDWNIHEWEYLSAEDRLKIDGTMSCDAPGGPLAPATCTITITKPYPMDAETKMKTSDLVEPALTWAVAACENLNPKISFPTSLRPEVSYSGNQAMPFSTWIAGGPIIEKMLRGQSFLMKKDGSGYHVSFSEGPLDNVWHGYGPEPFLAALRCYVASRLGDEVEIPEEIISHIKIAAAVRAIKEGAALQEGQESEADAFGPWQSTPLYIGAA